jgi:hypothetical protein
MSVDLNWQSLGGVLLDGTGDIAFTVTPYQCLQQMTNTRLKAAVDAWKLYPTIGADLESAVGQTVSQEIQQTLQRQVQASLTNDFLPSGSFSVKTVPVGDMIQIFVFLGNSLLASTTVNT